MTDIRNTVFQNHKEHLFYSSVTFTGFIEEMRKEILYYLKDYGFDVVETPADTLRVFYKKGQANKTFEDLKKYIPVENLKVYYEFIEVIL